MDSDGMIGARSTRLMHRAEYRSRLPDHGRRACGISGSAGDRICADLRTPVQPARHEIGVVSDDDDDGNCEATRSARQVPQPSKPAGKINQDLNRNPR